MCASNKSVVIAFSACCSGGTSAGWATAVAAVVAGGVAQAASVVNALAPRMIRILLIICSLKFFTLEVSKRGRAQQLFGVSAHPALQPRMHRVMPLPAVVRLQDPAARKSTRLNSRH